MDNQDIKIRLRNRGVLTGTGYVWEDALRQRGWNQLPIEQQFAMIPSEQVCEAAIAVFPHCDDIRLMLCPDEYEIDPDDLPKARIAAQKKWPEITEAIA